MFRQLVYTSQATGTVSEALCDEILDVSRRNNVRDEVTGFLISSPNGTFIQTLEGPPDGVARVLERIGQDPRHCSLTIILDHEVPTRDFSNWKMGYRSARSEDLMQAPEFRNLWNENFAANFDSATIALSVMKALYDANR